MTDADRAEVRNWIKAWRGYVYESKSAPDHIPVDAALHAKLREYTTERSDCLGEDLTFYDEMRFRRIPVVVK